MATFLLKDGLVFVDKCFKKADVLIEDGVVIDISPNLVVSKFDKVFSFNNCIIIPGLVDVHVHLREPGFFYKETIKTGTAAAARGGFTRVCTMPNLNPVPDSVENLKEQLEIIEKDALINVSCFGAITKNQQGKELADLEELSKFIVGFSDDGKGVQNEELMLSAMKKAKELGKIITAHCEEESLIKGGYIHEGKYASENNHLGICSESEYLQVKRDLELVQKTGCAYHICHISTKETVQLVRQAKEKGLNVTCETAPHYLVFCDQDLEEDGRFKMNPPIRSKEDRQALIQGIKDGVIDVIATDHAPHSKDEKSKGLKESLMGVVGLETAFAVLYTELVKTGQISLEKLIELMQVNPSKRFMFENEIGIGKEADLTVFDLGVNEIINSKNFLSKGKATPFDGRIINAKCKLTMAKGRIVWQEN